MATLVLAVVVTAAIVGVASFWLGSRRTTSRIASAIAGRADADPVAEHRRTIAEAQSAAARAGRRSDVLELSLDALTSGVVVVDQRGAVVFRNRFASAVSGLGHEQPLVDGVVTELLAAATAGRAAEREIELFGPPNRTFFVNALPIRGDSELVGAVAVIDDMTDHQRIDKTRRDFVANLSHELRTPVGAAALLAEMLVDETDAATRRQLSERLLAETDRITATIDDLLELSRIEGADESYDQLVRLRDVVAEALARTRVIAESNEIEVGFVGPDEAMTVSGNRDQLLTAVVNLVENAIKYSSPGAMVSVRLRAMPTASELIVQDSGRGIPARDLDRIFERFYRVDKARESNSGGTGIGLSIVRHVALNHGGAVTVSSVEGDGSTFTLSLPRQSVSEPASSPSELS